MVSFQGAQLMKQDGSLVQADDVINSAKIIAVYFSAHWCPPCRGFTPVLKDFWEEVKDSGLVILFVSSDRSADDAKSYFTSSHGDYYAVPFESQELIKGLKESCQVRGIPSLCVINKSGKCLYAEGRSDVTSFPPHKVVEKWGAL